MNHSLQHRTILWTSLAVILAASLLATVVSLYLLYQESLRSQSERLRDTVQSIGRFVNVIHRHSVTDHEPEHTMGQLMEAHQTYGGFGTSGEFLIGRRDGNDITYVLAPRHASRSVRVPWGAQNGEPMRLALSGETGTVIARDYRGHEVLAAYLPITDMQLGLVAKMDLAEIRAPFVTAAFFATAAALALAAAATLLFRRRISPLITAIERSEQRYRALFELSPYGIVIVDPATLGFVDFNHVAHAQLGYTREQFAKLHMPDVMVQPDKEQLHRCADHMREQGLISYAAQERCENGELRQTQVSGRVIADAQGDVIYCIHEDITERVRADAELAAHRQHLAELVRARTSELEQANAQLQHEIAVRREAEQRLRLADVVFQTTDQGVSVTDAAGTILAVNPAFTTITGYSQEEAIGNNPRMLKSDHQDAEFYRLMWAELLTHGRYSGRIWNRRKNGEAYLEQLTITLFRDAKEQPSHYVAVFSDITDLHEKERHIHHQAYHDALTDLPNRLLYHDRLTQALTHAARSSERVAVMFLDLDRFKVINDTLGHSHGDRLLRAVSARLSDSLRESDTISRFGGDEFVILATGLRSGEDAEHVARTLVEAFSRPFRIDDQDLVITPSIGIAVYPGDGADVDTLLKNADTAMYRAKDLGRNTFQFYTPEMNARALAHLTLENELRRAVHNGELELHYQPRVSLRTGRINGMEALVRWRHSVRGLVSPAEFIPLAEETGLIVPLGEWVLAEACRQTRAWQQQGHDLRVSVNISARQFGQPDLLRKVDDVLAASGLAGDRLELELTETLLMRHPEETIDALKTMKRRGICIAVDDFGTGYSSLNYLRRFPIDTLKIDRSFIRDISTDADAAAIAETIAALGRSLRMEVIAEGVETQQQLRFLCQQGCDAIQGYLFSPPVPPDAFIALVNARRTLECPRVATIAATGS